MKTELIEREKAIKKVTEALELELLNFKDSQGKVYMFGLVDKDKFFKIIENYLRMEVNI